ncbi:unnamed protein product [Protopolystoma xenopodis]|uniref:Uncharacterized protein n=1 Tax=Protopolystoma xenopodis TaxID=117903 RepID=A0A448WCG2_9PLAT|nr:unnamed protein product [Protopolystoma xenopodis]
MGRVLLNPVGDFYTNLAQTCVDAGCSVDIFLFPSSYVDLATIAEVPKITGGHIFKYTCFQADLHGEQFLSDLSRAVARPRAFDAVLRVRTSTGTRPVDFLGRHLMRNTTDVELACIDDESCPVTVEIKHDDKLSEGDIVYIQDK